MPDRTPTSDALTRQWADRIQDLWEINGRHFQQHELESIREAARSLPPGQRGVDSVSAPDYQQRITSDLVAALDTDTEAGWELIVRVLCAD